MSRLKRWATFSRTAGSYSNSHLYPKYPTVPVTTLCRMEHFVKKSFA